MSKTTRIAILLALAAMPLLEIGVLIRVGQAIGPWRLALLVIATAILGTIVIRRVGLSMIGRAMAGMDAGRDGLHPLFDGLLQVMAGMLLIFPGLISDAIGIVLLLPPIRSFLINNGLAKILAAVRFDTESAQRSSRRGQHGAEPGHHDRGAGSGRTSGPTIEGEYERVDETPVTPGTELDQNNNQDPKRR